MPADISPFDLDPQKVGQLMDLEAGGKLPEAYKPILAKMREMGALPPAKPQLPTTSWQPGAIPPPPSPQPRESTLGGLDYQDYFNTPKEFGGPGVLTPRELGVQGAHGLAVGMPSTLGAVVGSRFGPWGARAGGAAGAMLGQAGVETYDAVLGQGSEHPVLNVFMAGGFGALTPPPQAKNVRFMESAEARKGRNQEFLEAKSNPEHVDPLKVGPSAQDTLVAAHKAARDPLMDAYDTILQGPLGQVEVIKGTPGTQPTTFADMHSQASELKAQAKRAILGGTQADVARGYGMLQQVTRLNEQMMEAATKAGVDSQPYQLLNDVYKRMNEQFENSFMRQVKATKGAGVVDLLANPSKWKSFRMSGQGANLDVPDLLHMLESNLGPQEFRSVQSAVGKRILDQSMKATGDVDAHALWNRLSQLNSQGILDQVVPNGQKLMEGARLLAKYQESHVQRVPGMFGRVFVKVANKAFEYLDKPPDLAVELKDIPPGHPFRGALMQILGRSAASGALIPPPPGGQ